jgi:apolipoprotein N-acyltransferase
MFEKMLKKVANVCWFIPGVLLWASFPPMQEKTDVLFALAPLIWLARNSNLKKNCKIWFFNGLLFWVATLAWMPAIIKNGGPWPLVVLGWFVLALYLSLYFLAFGYLNSVYWAFARERSYVFRLIGILLIEPILWAGLELVRSNLFGGFAWNQLGVCLVNSQFGMPSSIGGVYLCSIVVVLINGTIASIAERMLVSIFPQKKEKKTITVAGTELEIKEVKEVKKEEPVQKMPKFLRSMETFIPFALIFLIYNASSRSMATSGADNDFEPLSVAVVQRDFPCVFSSDREENPKGVYSKLLANISMLRPKLLVLPESAFCEVGLLDSKYAGSFASFLADYTKSHAVIAGGSRRDAEGREFNSAALYTFATNRLNEVQIYDKVHLVPFGEYIPGDKIIKALQKLAPVGSCTPGKLKILDFNGLKIGVAICYEDTDSAQIRQLAKMGANVLVFITNDSWFSHSDEALQHYWQSVARAIETGLPVVRVGNSGVSGFISPSGKGNIMVDSEGRALLDAKGAMFDFVQPRVGGSFYLKYGDLPLAFLFAAVLGVLCYIKKWRRLKKL